MRYCGSSIVPCLFLALAVSQNAQGFSVSGSRSASRSSFVLPSDPVYDARERQRSLLVRHASESPADLPEEPFIGYQGEDELLLSPLEMKTAEKGVGGYDPSERIGTSQVNVGDPQIKVQEKERSVTSILRELAAIQQQGPQKYCILGTRHCSYLHQQIIELL